MAKKIIHNGSDTYHARCTECGCEFSYERADVNRYGLSGETVSCPHCGKSLRHLGENGTQWPEPRRRWGARCLA